MDRIHDDNYYELTYIAKIESKIMQWGFTIVVLGRIAYDFKIDIRNLFDEID